jgi:outer membrane protein OmpA-like peptidoglycan-associated protein
MSDANDDVQNYALAVLAGVVALVVAGVIALAVSTSRNAVQVKPAAAAVAQEAQPRVYFEVDSDALPADAVEVLNRVADAARGKPGTTVLISGFHDATGNPEHNADLAKRRAHCGWWPSGRRTAIGIVTAYNDMLSAHQPLRALPRR